MDGFRNWLKERVVVVPVLTVLALALSAVNIALAWVLDFEAPVRAGLAMGALQFVAMATTDLLLTVAFWIKRRFFA